ncbi:hypothetical protein X474_14750 [Dethiosulfatarculus sandiegensis]|uniref:Uncharacterized protein n=1 Tax=Dethiosulfatarculus sandiegensis TaxID=1429043 RepID=A0A0D2HRQ5_9BACT|nr:hypothetical protein X474_14750 [Dethiosulfatarculus sandiegensis]
MCLGDFSLKPDRGIKKGLSPKILWREQKKCLPGKKISAPFATAREQAAAPLEQGPKSRCSA